MANCRRLPRPAPGFLPYGFTEQRALLAATVLSSPVEMSAGPGPAVLVIVRNVGFDSGVFADNIGGVNRQRTADGKKYFVD